VTAVARRKNIRRDELQLVAIFNMLESRAHTPTIPFFGLVTLPGVEPDDTNQGMKDTLYGVVKGKSNTVFGNEASYICSLILNDFSKP